MAIYIVFEGLNKFLSDKFILEFCKLVQPTAVHLKAELKSLDWRIRYRPELGYLY